MGEVLLQTDSVQFAVELRAVAFEGIRSVPVVAKDLSLQEGEILLALFFFGLGVLADFSLRLCLLLGCLFGLSGRCRTSDIYCG